MSLVPTTRLGPFPLGMDNRVPDYKMALPDEAGHLLRDALNVDIGPTGAVKTRFGFLEAQRGRPYNGARPVGRQDGIRSSLGAGLGATLPSPRSFALKNESRRSDHHLVR